MARVNANYEGFDFRSLKKDKDEEEIKEMLLLMAACYACGYINREDVDAICEDGCLDEEIDIEHLGSPKMKIYFIYKAKGVIGSTLTPEQYAAELTEQEREEYQPNVKLCPSLFTKEDLRLSQAKKFHEAYWLGAEKFLQTGLSARAITQGKNTIIPGTDMESYKKALPAELDHTVTFERDGVYLQIAYNFSKAAFDSLDDPDLAMGVAEEMVKVLKIVAQHPLAVIRDYEHLADDISKGSKQRSLLEWLTSPEVIPDEKERQQMEAVIAAYAEKGFKAPRIIDFVRRRNPDYVQRAEELAAQTASDTTTDEPQSGSAQTAPDNTDQSNQSQQVNNVLERLQKYDCSFWLLMLHGVEGFDASWLDGQPQEMNISEVMAMLARHNAAPTPQLNAMLLESVASLGGDTANAGEAQA